MASHSAPGPEGDPPATSAPHMRAEPDAPPPPEPAGESDESFDDEGLESDDRWDRDDPRRQRDQMAPPQEPCECYCLHCGRTFMSDKMWFQRVVNDPKGFAGFWMCPTPNCGGAGFTFDVFPTDPDHPANEGWHSFDTDEEEWDEEDLPEGENEYDPGEAKWKALDEEPGDAPDGDDLEGEEWKYGLQPGERPPMSAEDRERWERAQRDWEEEQKIYDEPDRRPREIDWSDRETERGTGSFGEDDIPF